MHARYGSFVAAAALATLLASCGSESTNQSTVTTQPVYPIKGTVSLNGQPAAKVRAVFHPKADIAKKNHTEYTGVVLPDGSVNVDIYGGAGDKGLLEGEYVITFYKPEPRKSFGLTGGEPTDLLGGAYSDPTKSQYTISVGPSASNDFGTVALEADEAANAAKAEADKGR